MRSITKRNTAPKSNAPTASENQCTPIWTRLAATRRMITPDTTDAAHHNARRFVTSATIGGTSPHNAIAAITWPLGNEGPPLLTSGPTDGRSRPTLDLITH